MVALGLESGIESQASCMMLLGLVAFDVLFLLTLIDGGNGV